MPGIIGCIVGIAATLFSQVLILNLTSIKERRELARQLLSEIRLNDVFLRTVTKIADDWKRTGKVFDPTGKPVGSAMDFSRLLGRPLQHASYDAAQGHLGILPTDTVDALNACYSDVAALQAVFDRKDLWASDPNFMFQRTLGFAEAAHRSCSQTDLIQQLQREAEGHWLRWVLP